MRNILLKVIDFFYPPFSKWLPLQTFRYLVSGGCTLVSGIITYYACYHWILRQKDINIEIPLLPHVISAPTAALAIETCITFTIGFLLNKYLIFNTSNVKSRIQLFRYVLVWTMNLILTYALLKLLHEKLGVYPTVAKAIIAILLAFVSYFSQKHFTFKTAKK